MPASHRMKVAKKASPGPCNAAARATLVSALIQHSLRRLFVLAFLLSAR